MGVARKRNVPEEYRDSFGYGDVWTWTALCADTKLVPSWLVGERTTDDALVFMRDLQSRLANRVQLTTDGHKSYLVAVETTFGADIDYAMLHKIYGRPEGKDDERRYSPAVCTGIDKRVIEGHPDPALMSTSYVERQNLTMRMGMRRFTRLTNTHRVHESGQRQRSQGVWRLWPMSWRGMLERYVRPLIPRGV